jgi:prepilin-type N-terminal cleavage/methylation domain-containing protein
MYQLSRNKGFSLIELLVVIAIFVIGLAVALPSLMNVGRRNVVKNHARKIKDALYAARMTAVELNEVVSVQINKDLDNYVTTVVSSGRVLDRYTFENTDIDININPSIVNWNSRGMTNNNCTISVQNQFDNFDVVVSSAGNVRIARP